MELDIKIIGAGFGRTGTSSLREALEILGFDKCYHMSDTKKGENAKKWLRKARKNDISWEAILNGCKAGVDWPVSLYYEELADIFPQAKLILTVRDADSWYQSITKTVYRMTCLIPIWKRLFNPTLNARYKLLNDLIWNGIFKGRIMDEEFAKDTFNQHNQTVKERYEPDRLLVYDVSEGWEPLCNFLGVPIPEDRPFPKRNLAQEREKDIFKLRLQNFLFMGFLILTVVFSFWHFG